jgi:hypothetical protein
MANVSFSTEDRDKAKKANDRRAAVEGAASSS